MSLNQYDRLYALYKTDPKAFEEEAQKKVKAGELSQHCLIVHATSLYHEKDHDAARKVLDMFEIEQYNLNELNCVRALGPQDAKSLAISLLEKLESAKSTTSSTRVGTSESITSPA